MKIPLLPAGSSINNPGENKIINRAGMMIFKGRALIFISLFEIYKIDATIAKTTGLIIIDYVEKKNTILTVVENKTNLFTINGTFSTYFSKKTSASLYCMISI